MSTIMKENERERFTADKLAALGSLYEGLFSGATTAASVTTALLGAVVVYITAATALVDEILRTSVLAGALLPAPMWIAALIQSMVTATTMVRSVSIRAVERRLLTAAGLSGEQGRYFGVAAAEAVMNVTMARWPHKITTLLAYGSAGGLGLLFTTYVLVRTAEINRGVAYGGAVLYALAVIVVCVSALAGLRFYQECAARLLPSEA